MFFFLLLRILELDLGDAAQSAVEVFLRGGPSGHDVPFDRVAAGTNSHIGRHSHDTVSVGTVFLGKHFMGKKTNQTKS